ncbi:MAG: hypothetical protein IPI21_06575 [Propionivibrio sp.]|nr:hypothetical protein [Propionivibrio sp.]
MDSLQQPRFVRDFFNAGGQAMIAQSRSGAHLHACGTTSDLCTSTGGASRIVDGNALKSLIEGFRRIIGIINSLPAQNVCLAA